MGRDDRGEDFSAGVGDVPTQWARRIQGGDERFWECPRCRLTLDALLDPGDTGSPYIVGPGRIACPKCGSRNLDLETISEGDDAYATRMAAGRIQKARYVPPIEPELVVLLAEADGTLEASGIFGMEIDEDKEPVWPRSMCKAIIGCTAFLGRRLRELAQMQGPLSSSATSPLCPTCVHEGKPGCLHEKKQPDTHYMQCAKYWRRHG